MCRLLACIMIWGKLCAQIERFAALFAVWFGQHLADAAVIKLERARVVTDDAGCNANAVEDLCVLGCGGEGHVFYLCCGHIQDRLTHSGPNNGAGVVADYDAIRRSPTWLLVVEAGIQLAGQKGHGGWRSCPL